MDTIIECVPNFSEGKDQATIKAIAAAIESVKDVKLLDVDAGADFNRTVYTFVGEPHTVLEAAFQAARVGLSLIDMRTHKGEHARMGALDVMPFIPIRNSSKEECIELSKKFGKRMADELGVPVFLYAHSAQKPDRVKLPSIRKGEYEALEEKFKDPSFAPDFGKASFVPKSGATATGARDILIAYNVNLNTSNKKIASSIAGKIRTSGVLKKDEKGEKIIGPDGKPERIPGKFNGVQAGGMMYNEDIAQVSMNLLHFRDVNLHDVYEAIKEEAEAFDIKVTGSEIVGLVPKEALVQAGSYYAQQQQLKITNDHELVLLAIKHLGLSDLYSFKPDEKIIEYMVESQQQLIDMNIQQFLDELASDSPAPGGGSVAALAGALGCALSSMVCNLTKGKEKYLAVEKDILMALKKSEQLRSRLTELIDEDTQAFNDVMKAFKLPKDTDEQKKQRSAAIQEGYKKAAEVPLKTAEICAQILDVALVVAKKGNQNSITDAGVSALLARAGVSGAALNVKINLGSIKDTEFVEQTMATLEKLEETVGKQTQTVLMIVDDAL